MRSKIKNSNPRGEIDKWFLLVILILSIFGLLFVYNASSVVAQERFGNSFHYFKSQFFNWILAIIGLYLAFKIRLDYVKRFSKYIFIITIILLMLVYISPQTYGANRWIYLGNYSFQPSEIAKLSLIILLASIASDKKNNWMVKFLSNAFIIMGLVVVQPDLDTTFVMGVIALGIYFVTGVNYKIIFKILGVGILALISLIVIQPYRLQRLLTFINNEGGTESSYHIWQVLLAIGTGGWFGQGLGMSRFKYGYIPEAVGDSIFAIIGEELGFLGSTILILLFLWLVLRILKIAQSTNDLYYKYIAVGIGCWIGAQSLVNIASMVALIPLTGITLPFISFGGTSIISVMIASGWILQISQNSQDL